MYYASLAIVAFSPKCTVLQFAALVIFRQKLFPAMDIKNSTTDSE